MKRLAVIILGIVLITVPANAQHGIASDFANAKWIAMEADSTILFPHVHLLKAKSEKGQSLKAYQLPVLTKTVRLDGGQVKRAWVDVCGLGQYELFVNGEKAGDYFLSPGWTMYDKELLYNELDVTELLTPVSSPVTIKVMLGGGMYDIPLKGYHKMGGSCGAPKLLLCLHVEYEGGTTQTVVSDESWMAAPGPVRYSSIYAGEWHDATLSVPSGQPSAPERPVIVTRPHWDAKLTKQQEGTFVRVDRQLPFVQIADSLYDMGQNCSGIVRIKVRGERGKSITLRPAEILKDGKAYQRSMPGYEWKYTLMGNASERCSSGEASERCSSGEASESCSSVETWQPQFTYTGFRYVEVKADEGVELLELTGLHTTTDASEVGAFECSDTLFNQIHSLIDWAIRSNLVSITTDCPTREKLGWQEQNHLMAHSMMYRYDLRPLMIKIADDLAASQHADGAVPTIAPEYVRFDSGSGFEDTPEWGASFILCPWYTYRWYGDDSALRKHYDGMKRYIGYLLSRCDNGILDYGLGDWYDMGPERPGKAQLTSVALTATAMLYYELTTMEQIATHIGRTDDARQYAGTAAEVKQAFNRHFATDDEHVYENGSQTGLAMALYMNLVTDDTRRKALNALVRDIEQRGYALTAGDVGFRYVVQALQQNGRSDVIYLMNHNDAVPGYAYQLRHGATALTESWQAYDNVSNNHLMLGHLMEWLYGGLGGITASDSAWRHIVIAPQMVGEVTWTRTSLCTPRGRVACHWTRDNGQWSVDVTVPEGSDAEVCLPDGRREAVKGGNHSFSSKEFPSRD